MKSISILFTFFMIAFNVQAETCTAIIQSNYGAVYERFNANSYGREAACSEALYQCNRSLSDAHVNGRYYDASCVVESVYNPFPIPPRPTPSAFCQTDLVDNYGRLFRSFTSYGRSDYEACASSEQQCRSELYRSGIYGGRCVTRGNGPTPRPPQNKTETCQAYRYDPAGMYIQSYSAYETGPIFSDVKAMACNKAYNLCQLDLRGRQYCQVAR